MRVYTTWGNVSNFGLLHFWICPISSITTEHNISETVSALRCTGEEAAFKMCLMLNTEPSSVSEIQGSLLNARGWMKVRNSAVPSVMCYHQHPLEFNVVP